MTTQHVHVPTGRESVDGKRIIDVEAVIVPAPVAEGPVIADPGPLGLAAFAMTTFVLSVFNAHIIGNASSRRSSCPSRCSTAAGRSC